MGRGEMAKWRNGQIEEGEGEGAHENAHESTAMVFLTMTTKPTFGAVHVARSIKTECGGRRGAVGDCDGDGCGVGRITQNRPRLRS